MTPAPRRLLTLQEVAEYLQIPAKTLYAWRHKSEGPEGIRVGRHVRYRPEEIERWLDDRDRTAA